MKFIKPLGLIITLLFVSQLKAEVYTLDLEASISIAKMKSLDILSLKEDLKIAEANLKSATSRFKTHVNLDLNTPNYTETIRQFEDTTGIVYYPVRQSSYTGNLQINQPLPTDGNIYISSTLNSTSDFNDDKRLANLRTGISLRQPIDALWYNSIRSSFKTAQLNYERSQKSFKRAELNLIYNVSSAFYRLLSVQKSEEIARANLERQQEAYDIANNKFKAGLIREVDALQMEVDLAQAQNNYELSLIDQSSAQNNFKMIIGIELNDSVIISSSMEYVEINVNPDKAVELALQNRLEIREQEIQIELSKLNIKQTKAAGLISGDLNASYDKIGYSTLSLDEDFTRSLDQSYNSFVTRPWNFTIGLSVHIPIIDWGENKARVNAAKARLQQNLYNQQEVERSIITEVKSLVDDLNSSLKRLKALEKNVKVAEKSFEITRARYSDGDVDSQNLALERDRLDRAYNTHLSAYINYQLKQADLMRKTFYDFKKNIPIN